MFCFFCYIADPKLNKMRKYILTIVIFLVSIEYSYTQTEAITKLNSIKEVSSNKVILLEGIKLDSEINTDNLVKVKPTTINASENTSDSKSQPIKKEKSIKPVKVLKYGIKNKEDE